MKRILYISGGTTNYLNPANLALDHFDLLQINCLNNLKTLAIEKKPGLLIWERDTKMLINFLKVNFAFCSIPLLSIIRQSEVKSWKPIHVHHKHLVGPFSEKQLFETIELLLNKRGNSSTSRSNISNIDALKLFIEENGEQVSLDNHKIIFKENRHCSFIYLIKKGMVKTSRMDQLGKELITGIYRKNELLGLYGFNKNPTYPEMAATLEPSKLYRILHKEFREILQENQNLSLDIAQNLSDTVLTLKSQLLEMAYASVLKKTSNTILQFAEELQNPDMQGLKISRTDLASIAGISPESFIRSLSSLKKEGIIAIKGKKINILKPDRLQEIT
ncbi:Crp/Fnr family transcriptional regulator [Salegentibacter sp. Hel_I_6]|uniref:Crp/Fnr family transcriptional regulator n=1 Tax=Salegentibacter sp. Hel_I_6 TaxID=1250278 RepID=UPI00068C71BA|nr:Crp/Fnr family transcriptional regulator [Salegentibacter sp. Hel_I_6]